MATTRSTPAPAPTGLSAASDRTPIIAGASTKGNGSTDDENTIYGDLDNSAEDGGATETDDDVIYGDAGNDTIYAGAGNDRVFSFAGRRLRPGRGTVTTTSMPIVAPTP